MSKLVLYEDHAREEILKGITEVAKAVGTTMGPRGRNVLIDRPGVGPVFTHDGVTVAKAMDLSKKNPARKAGADLLRRASMLMNDEVGDGTTTVSVLTAELAILMASDAKKTNSMAVKHYYDGQLPKIVEALREQAVEVKTLKELTNLAVVSSQNEELGKLIAEVVHTIGAEGTVSIEETSDSEDSFELISGYTFDQGYAIPHMANNREFTKAVYNNVPVLVVAKKIAYATDIVQIMDALVKNGSRELVIICAGIEGEALTFLAHNKQQSQFFTLAVKAPGVGNVQKDYLADIAVTVGATLIDPDQGDNLREVTLDQLGKANKVISTKEKTSILTDESKEVLDWIKGVRERITESKSEHEKEQLTARVASLEGRVATIKIGGKTPQEVEEKRFRVDDAVAACKAGLTDGLVDGGGMALRRVVKEINIPSKLGQVLKYPSTVILDNAGLDPDVLDDLKPGTGIDVLTGAHINMQKAGIVDPVKATIKAVETAFSIAGMAITTGALIIDEPEKEDK